MTLILAFPTEQGIILASDTQYTSGEIRTTGRKIFPLNNCCAWAGSGEVALIQRVQEHLETIPLQHPLSELRDQLARSIQLSAKALLDLDVLTEYVQSDPSMLLSLHPGDFIFAEYFQQRPRMLHITSSGTPEWINTLFASGNGANFAYALLQKYQDMTLSLENASLLAYKVIDETIQVGAYGLDYPIDMWLIRQDGMYALEEREMKHLAHAANQLRVKEINLLLSVPIELLPIGKKAVPKARKKSASRSEK